jgi:signal transduction histidine kinase
VYFLAAKLGLKLAFVQSNATPVWPPAGIALAAMLLLEPPVWPSILAGAFLANLLTQGSLLTSAAIAIGNTLEAVAGATLINRAAGGRDALQRPGTIFRYLIFAAVLSPMISATVGVSSLSAGGYSAWANYWNVWTTWWLGDASSNLIVAPFLLLWFRKIWPLPKRRAAEAIALSATAFATVMIVFSGWVNKGRYSIQFLTIPLLIWTAFRFRQRGTTLLVLGLSTLAVYETAHGFGPMSLFSPNEALVLLQAFMATMAITGLLLSAVVSKQKETEEMLRASRESLVSINHELEQFAYGCSHDLKEPLRKIAAYTDLLRESFKKVTDPTAARYMDYITSGATRMQNMINDVLAFAEITRDRAQVEMVDLNLVLGQVMSDIEITVLQNQAVVTIDPLPVIPAFPFEMRRLFQNLILNGIKFHGPEAPQIRVSASAQGKAWLFSVEDNGIGVDPAYSEKIFGVFQRLHSKERYDGTGIGLSICKKIVESYGGKIWCEPAAGRGARFNFTLLQNAFSRPLPAAN